MFLVFIIIAIISIILFIGLLCVGEEAGLFFLLPAIIFGFLTLPLIQWNTGERVYTGYIYSAEDVFNKTIGHLRFSEYAGEDAQPSFCAIRDSEEANKIKELAGSGKKVRVTVPEGFVTNQWYGQCGLPATVEVLDEI